MKISPSVKQAPAGNAAPFMGPSKTIAAVVPVRRSRLVNVVVRPCPRTDGGLTASLIAELINQNLRDRVDCEKLDGVAAKGFAEPVTTYRFLGFRRHRTERKFVGRAAEVGMAAQALQQYGDSGSGQILYIRQHTGHGKTALLDKVLGLAAQKGSTAIAPRCSISDCATTRALSRSSSPR